MGIKCQRLEGTSECCFKPFLPCDMEGEECIKLLPLGGLLLVFIYFISDFLNTSYSWGGGEDDDDRSTVPGTLFS